MVKTVDSTETAYLETTDQSESRKEKRPVVARTRTCVIRDRRSLFSLYLSLYRLFRV